MSTIFNPNALIASIDVNQIPDTTEKMFFLPGREISEVNALSGKQMNVALTWIKANISGGNTYTQGCIELRNKANIKGASRDFGAINWIVEQGRHENADAALTPSQEKLRTDIMSALSGEVPHWEPTIARKIAALTHEDRTDLIREFRRGKHTRGGLTAAMNDFTALVGKIPSRADRLAQVDLQLTGDELMITDEEFTAAMSEKPF